MTGPLIKVSDWSPQDSRRAVAAFWREIGPVILSAVENSFVKAKMLNPTGAEAKRRVEVAKGLVQEMVELRWSTPRIRDVLSRVLDSKLLGLEVDLEVVGKRAIW